MIRGAKIYGLLLLHDAWRTFCVDPRGIFSLLMGLLLLPVFLPLLMISTREVQNSSIDHGLGVMRLKFIRRALIELLDESEVRARRILVPAHFAMRNGALVCIDCHVKAGCAPPLGAPLDHGCHRGTCPFEKKV